MDVTATGGASAAAAYYQAASAENIYTKNADKAFTGDVNLKKPDGTIVSVTALNIKLESVTPKMSPEMLSHMIQSMQKITDHMDHRVKQSQQQEITDTQSDGILSKGIRNGLDDIASDPVYAAKRARELGTLPQLHAWDATDFPKNGDPASVWDEFHSKTVARMELTGQITRARSNYYHDMIAQNIPPAEIYAKLLEFNANLPQSTGNSAVSETTYSVGGWDSDSKAQHDYLMKALAKA